MPFRKIFLSRWSALLWAAGILWTAIDTVGFGPPANGAATIANASVGTDAAGVAVNADDLATLANAMKS
ncbi:hypothetical protein [Sphingomonas sp. 10B4]|uniref:hypothetical protein n=1 Tax=Sphingomonas sp. 10B4 TaxID=3048575 RepID=UPI002AB34320|nr:hypothetical protein [Sphingomonas sp. 10B4]MDY7522703.1 hypothetical protein [Sphingomonas sp. 10B4]MEB0283566.1 hypothetical protein [Sphingomonas sp. 10B4]